MNWSIMFHVRTLFFFPLIMSSYRLLDGVKRIVFYVKAYTLYMMLTEHRTLKHYSVVSLLSFDRLHDNLIKQSTGYGHK